MSKVILDGTALRLYGLGKATFHGGTEQVVKEVARGLAGKGHTVHVVTPDLDTDEQRGPTEFWWGPENHPTTADVVVMAHSLENVSPYSADRLILLTNGVDPDLGPGHSFASHVDAFPVFSQTHADLLVQHRPTVDPAKVHVTGLGVAQIRAKPAPVPGRIFFSNNPANGLWHVLDIYDALKQDVPAATLHIGYDFDGQFARYQWEASSTAEMFWECKRRIETTPGITNLGALDRAALETEERACQVHVMPQDSQNPSTTIWGLTAMECAASGAALVLSDNPGYQEVFGEAATLLPLPGTFLPALQRRYDAADWAEAVAGLMKDETTWTKASRKSRKLAEKHTWRKVIGRWEAMLAA